VNRYRLRLEVSGAARDYDVLAKTISAAISKLSRHVRVRETSIVISGRLSHSDVRQARLEKDVQPVDDKPDTPPRSMAQVPPRHSSRGVFDFCRAAALAKHPRVMELVLNNGLIDQEALPDDERQQLREHVAEVTSTYDWPRFVSLVAELEHRRGGSTA
jgi:hypothetical protein